MNIQSDKITRLTRAQLVGWYILLSIQALSYGSYAVLVHLCEQNGAISFNSLCMNFLIEFIKLIISSLGYAISKLVGNNKQTYSYLPSHDTHSDDERSKKLDNNNSTFSWLSLLSFSVPAALYFINNNLAVYIQLYMDSTTYQMLSNFKIITTAVLYYFIIGKKISNVKWISLTILFISGLFYSLANFKSSKSMQYMSDYAIKAVINMNRANEMNDNKPLHLNKQSQVEILQQIERAETMESSRHDEIFITEIGLVLVLVYCFLSGLSGVYNEYLLKLNFSESIFVQNMYLYLFGTLLNLTAFTVSFVAKALNSTDGQGVGQFWSSFFAGFNVYTWTIVFTQVFNGILMSVVMKYSSNLTRLFVISSSLIVTTTLSVLFFSLKLNLYYYFSFSAIMISLYLYTYS